eukprot:3976752-Pyramimonas_sp.AAC.1
MSPAVWWAAVRPRSTNKTCGRRWGDQQFGLAKDGCGALYRRLCAMANSSPGKWAVAVDLGD